MEQIVDVPFPQIRKENGKVIQLVPQERISDRVVEQFIDIPVTQIREPRAEVAKVISHDHLQQRTAEQIVDMPVSQIQEEIVEVIQLILQERISECIVERFADVPFSHAKVPAVQVAHKTVEIPQAHVPDKDVDVLVGVQHQTHTVHGAEKYRDEDEKDDVEIEAKNGLENYCFTARNVHIEERLNVKFEAGDDEKCVDDALDRVNKSRLAENDEFAATQKEPRVVRMVRRQQRTVARQQSSSKQEQPARQAVQERQEERKEERRGDKEGVPGRESGEADEE